MDRAERVRVESVIAALGSRTSTLVHKGEPIVRRSALLETARAVERSSIAVRRLDESALEVSI